MPDPKRILIVAKPTLGRSLETVVRSANYEVHRIPDVRLLDVMVARLRPHVVISAVSLASMESFVGGHLRMPKGRQVPVLRLGDVAPGLEIADLPFLPLPIEPTRLLETIHRLIDSAA